MNAYVVITIGLFILSIISGMLGLGVAFAAIPFLGLFLPDLVHQVQPLSLVLNGVTALFSVFGFARGGHMKWKKALILAAVTTVVAPFGAWLAHLVDQLLLWGIYFVAVGYLAYRLFRPIQEKPCCTENFTLALILAVPISVLAGLLGVGPGFLLMPTLMLVGFESKRAAAINAFAVMPPSFSALIPHIGTAKIDPSLAIPLIVVGAVGSFFGARLTSRFVPSTRIKQIFAILILITTLYKIWTLLR